MDISSDQSSMKTVNPVPGIDLGPQGRINSRNSGPEIKTSRNLCPHESPLANRRGILGAITLIPEYYDAQDYSEAKKLVIVTVVALAGTSGPMGTSIVMPAVSKITASLETTESMVNISVGIYLLALGVFSMWWSNFSEKHGRRNVYLISFSWFLAFSLGSCFVQSVAALIVLRLLSGVGASAVQACGTATVADLYVLEERGRALGIFYLGPLLGPFLSPILGGVVAEVFGWRATMWVMVIICLVNLLLILLLLPETSKNTSGFKEQYNPEAGKSNESDSIQNWKLFPSRPASLVTSIIRDSICENKPADATTGLVLPSISNNHIETSTEQHKISMGKIIYDYTVRPAHAIVLLGYPPMTLMVLYSGVAFMGVYFLNISLTYSFCRKPYGFNTIFVGLTYVPNSVAYLVTSIYGGKWLDYLLSRYAKFHNGE